ncbi:hypothetical protein HED60_20775 [Planctomycetales bacterium ZRK34]|nr:hypothetical protein HED60_20775 [Planctomycetales bacterium ZRK34]
MSMEVHFARIRKQLLADRKKFGMLLTLLLVGLLLWGRLLIHNVPRTATAVPPLAAAAPMPDNVPAPAAEATQRRAVEASLVGVVPRDVFAINAAYFPKLSGEENPSRLTKSVLDPTDDLEQQMRVIKAEAGDLKLQSTILGAQPRAMINGTLIGPGQNIAGFTVTEIRPRSITITKNGVTLELEM